MNAAALLWYGLDYMAVSAGSLGALVDEQRRPGEDGRHVAPKRPRREGDNDREQADLQPWQVRPTPELIAKLGIAAAAAKPETISTLQSKSSIVSSNSPPQSRKVQVLTIRKKVLLGSIKSG